MVCVCGGGAGDTGQWVTELAAGEWWSGSLPRFSHLESCLEPSLISAQASR